MQNGFTVFAPSLAEWRLNCQKAVFSSSVVVAVVVVVVAAVVVKEEE